MTTRVSYAMFRRLYAIWVDANCGLRDALDRTSDALVRRELAERRNGRLYLTDAGRTELAEYGFSD